MATLDAAQIVNQALPGKTITGTPRKRLTAEYPEAWDFKLFDGRECVLFVFAGEHLSDATKAAITKAKGNGLEAVLVAPSWKEVQAAAPFFPELRPSLACEVAGKGAWIPAFEQILQIPNTIALSPTRIPLTILQELAGKCDCLPEELRTHIVKLEKRYRSWSKSKPSDARESKALEDFTKAVLHDMGFRSEGDRAKTPAMIRSVEIAGFGARRDHFFHSYQNFFLGAGAICALQDWFCNYRAAAKLHWNVHPLCVWFLVALWHDTGYGAQKFGGLVDAVWGGSGSEVSDYAQTHFLGRDDVQEAMRIISSLIARLLQPEHARTDWVAPSARSKKSVQQSNIEEALRLNVLESHGALGALRLFLDFVHDLDVLEPENRYVLWQTVTLASCSMPFHDTFFRMHMRKFYGDFTMPTETMPFAALLAFVDSLQDDRRDIRAIREAANVLEQLVIQRPAVVSAEMNHSAVPPDSILEKIIESRDVVASLKQQLDRLYFKYPTWLSGQA